MKKSMITLAVLIFSLTSFAGTQSFNKEMKKNLKILRAYEENTDYNSLAGSFESIAKKNSSKFEPLYYAAYSYILGSWQVQNPEKKTEILEKAKKCIDQAKSISIDNDELFVLEAFYYQAMIMVNPQKYGQSYSAKANVLLTKAQKINNDNPRAQFLLAQNIYYTPVEYGGGKVKALPLFEKAAKHFEGQDNSNFLLPVWGGLTNQQMIDECENK